jgi:DNA-binding LacI/PurR family transcriptional regulator
MPIEPVQPRSVVRGRAAPPTSVDVARLAGVSRATVSHVVNGQVDRFSADTVGRVRAAAATLGYVPSAAGRALVTGRSDLVVLVVPGVAWTNIQEVIELLTADLDALGFTLLVHFQGAGTPEASRSRLLHTVETLHPAGVVDLGGLSGRDVRDLARTGCLLIGRDIDAPRPPESDPTVRNHALIGRLQAEHLCERGFTELAYAGLADRRADDWSPHRAAGVAQACAARGLAAPTNIDVPLDAQGARDALQGLVEQRSGRIGVACYSDDVGIGLVFAAQSLGLTMADGLGIIGVGGLALTQLVRPRLTTLRPDLQKAIAPVRHAIARAYGTGVTEPEPVGADAYSIVHGETT